MKTAVFYIAGGDSYCWDAVESRDSLRQHNPGVDVILSTDQTQPYDGWTQILRMPPRRYPDLWYLDSTVWMLETFNRLRNHYDALLYLDTDTYITDSLADMFELAERFDICASHGVSRHTTGTVGHIPNAFPEVEIGALLVRTNERVCNLFKDWLELYQLHPDLYGNNDQGPLREALWINKQIQLFPMPEEYHCRWGFGVCVVSKVRILHSRSPGYPNSLAAQQINSTGGRRLFRPGGVWWRPIEGEGHG